VHGRGQLVLLASVLAACAHARPPGARSPRLEIEAPRPGTFLREPEVEVTGRFRTYDGRAWIWIEDTSAATRGDHFHARIPLREGGVEIKVHLTDGRGEVAEERVRVRVESPDRPRPGRRCVGRICLDYEVRGSPRRNASQLITNAVVVLTPFGFDERLDELWPEMVGAGRPLDSRERFVVGVAPAHNQDGSLAPAADASGALEALADELALARPLRVVGASSSGAELGLRWLAAGPASIGTLVLCGGHDRPYDEPTFRRLETLVRSASSAARADGSFWNPIAELIVGASYTDAYLADARYANEHGLTLERAERFRPALVEKMARYWAGHLHAADLRRRIEDARQLSEHPLQYAPGPATQVRFVVNRLDRTISTGQVEETVRRLRAAGAQVELVTFEDVHGHSAFFRSSPEALRRVLGTLP
jgi:pimeloyl-ACP methyl ester carboxylesterase